MKGIAIAILVILLLGIIIQPLIETANLLKEKVTLGAAILNSCRAASNNALDEIRMSDLDAEIIEAEFKQYFAGAFCETLGLYYPPTLKSDGSMSFSSQNGRWNEIKVSITLDSSEIHFSGRETAQMDIQLSTPYLFRMSLLKETARRLPNAFNIVETRHFEIQIIN